MLAELDSRNFAAPIRQILAVPLRPGSPRRPSRKQSFGAQIDLLAVERSLCGDYTRLSRSADEICTVSIVGALYMKQWKISLQSGELGKRWKHAAQHRLLTQLGSKAMRLMRERVGRETCKDLMLQ
jgi:hypothetical protein